MSDFTCSFDPDIPNDCPPDLATQETRIVFRCVDNGTANERDFISDVKANRRLADSSNCQSWGCSVWADEKDVELALKLFKPFRSKYIVAGEVSEADGALMNTPSKPQPGHFTFWKANDVHVASKFSLFIEKGVKV